MELPYIPPKKVAAVKMTCCPTVKDSSVVEEVKTPRASLLVTVAVASHFRFVRETDVTIHLENAVGVRTNGE
jgi:hypothetical protein